MIDIKFYGPLDMPAEALSAGICDNCKVPKMVFTGGDGEHELAYEELYCAKKKRFIEPELPEYQIKECDGFELNENS